MTALVFPVARMSESFRLSSSRELAFTSGTGEVTSPSAKAESLVMTPDKKPFFAGTYLPKNSRPGMTGLVGLLGAAAHRWREDRKSLVDGGEEITEFLSEQNKAKVGETTANIGIIRASVGQYSPYFDEKWGGFGVAPKFPTPHGLVFLLRYSAFAGDGNARAMAEKTLVSMYRGGIFDHIGGGFSRYSTDEKWLVPHFEKMLYDNALMWSITR